MNKNATPQLLSSWWKSNQPDGLKSAAGLGKALLIFEKANDKLAKQESDDNYAAGMSALADIAKAAGAALKEADQTLKKPPAKGKFDTDDFENTVAALKKYDKLVVTTRKELEAAQAAFSDDDEDEDGEGLLNEAGAYLPYLRKTTKKLKLKALTFGLGIAKKPEDCRFLFHKTKAGKALSTVVKKETGLVKVTWGVAGEHTEKPKTLALMLEGKQLPGMARKLKKFLKAYKPLPFTDVMLMVDGKEVEDLLDEEEEREWGALLAEWKAWRDGPEVVRAIAETELDEKLSDLCERGDGLAEDRDDPDLLRKVMAQMAALIRGDDPASPAASESTPDAAPDSGGDQASLAALGKRLAAVIKGLAGVPQDKRKGFKEVALQARARLESGALPDAETLIEGLEKKLATLAPKAQDTTDTTGTTETDPDLETEAKRLAALLLALGKRVAALGKIDAARPLATSAKEAQSMIRAGQIRDAAKALTELGDAVRDAENDAEIAESGGDPQVIWRSAKETVDIGISSLQTVLKGFDHPDLNRIAEFGLNGATDGNQVALSRAILEYNTSPGGAKAAASQKLLEQVQAYRTFLSGSALIKLCEKNPFGVRVDITGPLGKALNQIEATVSP